MNIWLINHYANSPDTPGDARHFSHARELNRRGHNVRVIACSFVHLQQSHITQTGAADFHHAEYDGVPFTWLGARSSVGSTSARVRGMFDFARNVYRTKWAANLPPPDLILGSSPHPFAALAAERLARRYRVPFVLEIRDAWPFVLTEVGGHSRFHPFVLLVDRVMRHLYRRAAAIIMFSRDSADLLEHYGADKRKITWIPHGVDFNLAPVPNEASAKSTFTVTYIGAHGQWNSLDALLDAASLLKDEHPHIRFRFIGGGARKPHLVARARAEQLTYVEFLDPLPKQAIAPFLDEADCFILNNHRDRVSERWMSFNKLYEYLAAARPVVFGSCTTNDPVRESGAGLSVEADNPQALAEAVLAIANTPIEQRREYSRRGRRHIEEHYGISQLAQRFEDLALRVTTARTSPSARTRAKELHQC